jgi:hypothetical protein
MRNFLEARFLYAPHTDTGSEENNLSPEPKDQHPKEYKINLRVHPGNWLKYLGIFNDALNLSGAEGSYLVAAAGGMAESAWQHSGAQDELTNESIAAVEAFLNSKKGQEILLEEFEELLNAMEEVVVKPSPKKENDFMEESSAGDIELPTFNQAFSHVAFFFSQDLSMKLKRQENLNTKTANSESDNSETDN